MEDRNDYLEIRQRLQRSCTDWLEKQSASYLIRLQDNLVRRASCLPASAERSALFSQQLLIAAASPRATATLLSDLHSNLQGKLPYQTASNSALDQLNRLWQDIFPEQAEALLTSLRAISPVVVLAQFPNYAHQLELEPNQHNQALNLFNILVVKELPKLYRELQRQLHSVKDPQAELSGWLSHTSTQLTQSPLNGQQRALGQLRLQRLQNRLQNKSRPKIQPVSDETLLEVVANIFANVQTLSRLPNNLRATLNNLQNHCSRTALTDQQSFMNPLHPARVICQEVVSSCHLFEQATAEAQIQFVADLRHGVAQLENSSHNDNTVQALFHTSCSQLQSSAQLSKRRESQRQQGQENMARLRLQVHKLIDRKTENCSLSPEISELFYGPLTTIVIYFWSRHGSNSQAIQGYLKLIDDIIWYTHAHQNWNSLREAKDLGPRIESQLEEGLKRINYDQIETQKLIAKLHQLRYQALERSHIS
ncbi:DUF1631 family protein [Spongiibacter sp. KMU-158]|uniref:DUF1631 family protein n=1 Tax=Spongiibacter pelagi TaxID=2760804 RepID=A0A927GW43_9GAMM|nr:DUF1631 family protein [Spongiibacter pelagi]MBD2858738.1 DUF1631 family protein [Spongiibacter pelagi]